jgi:MFS family permease
VNALHSHETHEAHRPWPARLPFYYGWVNVVLAALAMLATLPGRTHGLGLVTEPLMADLGLDRIGFANINLWATLLGAVLCLPAGQLLDRIGTRRTLSLVLLALGLTVLALASVQTVAVLFVLVTLTRAFGQSALSVVSIAIVGKWFRRRVSLAMGIYSVLITIFFAASFKSVGSLIVAYGWRAAWADIGWALLLVFLPLSWLLVRSTPESCGVAAEPALEPQIAGKSLRLSQAVASPAFWVFAVGASLFGLVSSGISLFNQSILAELNEKEFTRELYYSTASLSMAIGLLGQFAAGWIGGRWSLRRLMAVALFLYGGGLLWLPQIHTLPQIWCYSVLMGVAGGIITVVFFAVWPDTFGRAHLGRIQGAAQMATVVASAVGPLIFAQCHEWTKSYALAFYSLAPIVLLVGLASWFVPTPKLSEAEEEPQLELAGASA